MDISNIEINNYNIFLDIDFNSIQYKGIVSIEINVKKSFSILEINSDTFDIKFLKINDHINDFIIDENKKIISIRYNFIEFNKYTIKIKFGWKKITDEPDGFYYTMKDNNIVLCTHLEPISARKFIPCFDYPNLKAHFNLIVKLNDLKKECISNMSVKKCNLIENNEGKIIYFNSTPVMSSYLLCLVCGDIKHLVSKQIKSKENIIINGYCIPRDISYIGWSIKKTSEALDYFEDWFGIKYPLDKLDIVAIPNFSAGAMENWGIITFREECVLLFDKSKYLEQLTILEVIYHEVAHQWFGNLVTLCEWKDLWLNESTATFFSWMALIEKYTDFNSKEFYWLLESKSVYIIDGFTNTHPIIMNTNSNNDNNEDGFNPVDLFDEITYSKGNTIINYVANLLGLENFKLSIRKYLNQYLYSNPPSGDKLFEYFNEYSTNKNINYIDLMNKLTTIKGYPILYIKKINNTSYSIKYKTFNLDKRIIIDYPIDLWIKFSYSNKIDILELKYNLINDINIDNISSCIINPNNEFFCICYYDNFIPNILLMNQVELMKYIHDEFLLSLYGYKKISEYFDCVKNILKLIDIETNYILVVLILGDLKHLINIFDCTDLKLSLKIKKFININLDSQLLILMKFMIYSSNKYSEFVIDSILTLETIYFEKKNLIDIVKKIYIYQNNLLYLDPNYSNKYFLSKISFNVVMKYFQSTEFDNIIRILKTTFNTQIITNIIGSFEFLNIKNFDIIFKNYKQLIKSQNYNLFFSSISKIKSKQEFIIDYLIHSRDEISSITEITFKIFKNVSKNIFDFILIDLILNYLQIIENKSNKIIIDKIKDILQTNKIIVVNNKIFIDL
jgi:tricorn protease interacting factor F2/3